MLSYSPRLITAALLSFTLSATLAGCDKPEQKAARHLARGIELAETGENVKARLEFKNVLQILPTDAESRYRLGLLDEAEGDYRNAYANYTQAQQQNTRHQGALLKLAQYTIAGDQLEVARNHLSTVLADTPDLPEARALMAGVLLREKKFTEAEKEALFALEKDPANTTAVSVLTGLYKAMGQTDKAAAAVEQGIARAPKDVSLQLLKATLFEQTGQFDKVAEAYEAIFRLRPKETAYRLSLSNVYLKAGKKDEAERTLRQTIADFPDRLDLKRQFVDFLSKARGLELAEKEVAAYMEQNPDLADPYFWLADLYIANEDVERAAALLEKVVVRGEQKPEGLNASASLARIHFAKGDRALAQKLVSAILAKAPAHPEALYVRASLAYEDGAYQAAMADLRTIVRDNPKTVSAYHLLSEVLLVQGRVDLAIDTLGKLLEHHPENAVARVRLAQLFEASGKAKFGLEHLALVTKTTPDYAIAWESTARLAISAHLWDQAKAAIVTLKGLKDSAQTAAFLTGQLLAAQGRLEDAAGAFAEVAKTSAGSPLGEHALGALAALYEKDGKMGALIDLIAPLPEKNAFALTLLGDAYAKTGKEADAAKAFDEAIAKGARNPKPYLGRAILHRKAKETEAALAVLEKARKALPADPLAPMMMADIYGDLGRTDDAIAVYEALLARNPDILAAANNLAQLVADHKADDSERLEKTRLLAERFISSPNPLFLDTLAWVYFRQNKLDQARTVMDRAMAMETAEKPLPGQMHYHYGALLARMGDTPRAIASLEKATTLPQDATPYDGLQDAKTLLAKLKR